MEKIQGFQNEYRWLSNFVPVKVEIDGIQYPSVEHAYAASKFLEPRRRVLISMASNAAEAKRMGKGSGVRDDWDAVKLDIMTELLIQKYTTPKYMKLLLETGDAYIEETNYWGDTYWGVCNGEGENHLGKIIMGIREMIREEIENSP